MTLRTSCGYPHLPENGEAGSQIIPVIRITCVSYHGTPENDQKWRPVKLAGRMYNYHAEIATWSYTF
jgi:hypothetical protein